MKHSSNMTTDKKNSLMRFRAKVFRALSDPIRLEIVEFLRGGEKCVCEIIPHIGVIQPLVSRHLRILKDCGLVKDRRDGVRRLYSITDNKILETIDSLTPATIASFSRRVIEQIAVEA
jgi:ArsR family transcriptional regulator